ncbi:hypothetical protein [Pelobacter propionicus]|uniref:hypothetical protein n=1 Tax=Pelobacter propionicus TaxID=29543 RepID=UPI00059FAD48|nr:hypothetical protein [Pelobacter propionicus]
MRRATRKNGHNRKRPVRPRMGMLVALWDRDPNAVMFDFAPVDLSGASRCPLCGSMNHGAGGEPDTPDMEHR